MHLQLRIMAVAVETDAVFRHKPPVVLFQTRAVLGDNSFEATPDGRRFLVRERAGEPNPALPMHIILNWPTLVAPPKEAR